MSMYNEEAMETVVIKALLLLMLFGTFFLLLTARPYERHDHRIYIEPAHQEYFYTDIEL